MEMNITHQLSHALSQILIGTSLYQVFKNSQIF